MLNASRDFFTIRGVRRAITRWRFERAFASEMRRVEAERARHARVRDAEAALQARVHDALRRRVSA